MPEIHCKKCGAIARPADIFCRICGSSLGSTTPKSALPKGMACLIAAGLVFSTLALSAILFGVFLARQPGGMPAVAIEMIGTSTPYPTRKPYPSAAPYKNATPYPTDVPYPTTGALATLAPAAGATRLPYSPIVPFNFGGCELRVKNKNSFLDSVIILSNIDTNTSVTAVYVRANDSFSKSGIAAGTYYTYIALGQDWDGIIGRFKNNAFYFRFKETSVFKTCHAVYTGGYEYLEITLNASEGKGADTIAVQPDDFPGFSP